MMSADVHDVLKRVLVLLVKIHRKPKKSFSLVLY